MRVIKFRAWDRTNRIMYYNVGLDLSNTFPRCVTGGQIDPLIALQYTGLKDKNGKVIYEGDKIDFNGDIFTILFKKGMFCVEDDEFFPIGHFYSVVKVIGNIYENPT